MIYRPTGKKLSVRRRGQAMTALMTTELEKTNETIGSLSIVAGVLGRMGKRVKARTVKRAMLRLLVKSHKISAAPAEMFSALPKVERKHRTIDSFEDEQITPYFRF